jgi:hypothetical protein
MLLSLLACTPEPSARAIVDPSRAEHFFDLPFPSDDQLDADGHPILDGFPAPEIALTAQLVDGWAARLGETARGFANNGSAYFRFDGPLALPARTDGLPTDPVLLVALDGSELLPLDLRFVVDPMGDPFWGENTLAATPRLGDPPRSGTTYAAVVMASDQVGPAEGFAAPPEVQAALTRLGVRGEVAVSTTFTVQAATRDLRALFADADARLPDFSGVTLRRVVRLRFAEGTTPSGNTATVATVFYEDGGSEDTFLSYDPGEVQDLSLGDDWPMVVYEARIPTLNYQDEDDRPYMSPGLAHLTDFDRRSGWIEFDAAGAVVSEPWTEPMRITISLPKGPDGAPLPAAGALLWDHGTGGHAYEIVQRPSALDDGRALATVLAEEGWAAIGRDATLYGQRFPLVDQGFTDGSLGFYNVVNLPAFRDNQRQTAVDGHVLLRFVQEALPDLLPAGGIDPARVRHGGHSLGSVTTNLQIAAEPGSYDAAFLSGTGGVFTHYALDTGLLGSAIDRELIDAVFGLVGVPAPAAITTTSILGSLLGLEAEAWENLDRSHPVLTLFQWTMDPSDPMAVARDAELGTLLAVYPGDRQTPDFTGEALGLAQPQATVRYCVASGGYDPHQCLWREPEGPVLLREWLTTEPRAPEAP